MMKKKAEVKKGPELVLAAVGVIWGDDGAMRQKHLAVKPKSGQFILNKAITVELEEGPGDHWRHIINFPPVLKEAV